MKLNNCISESYQNQILTKIKNDLLKYKIEINNLLWILILNILYYYKLLMILIQYFKKGKIFLEKYIGINIRKINNGYIIITKG